MLGKRLCSLLLASVLFLIPVCVRAEQEVPRLGQNGGAVVAAFGEQFLFFDPASPEGLCVIDAEDGSLAAWVLLGSSSGAEEGLWFRVVGEYALIQTPRYAYRMNRDLRIEERVSVPELPDTYSVSTDLTHAVYQDLIHIEQIDLRTGETERLLVGDYDSVPQRIYSSPVYLADDTRLLVFENTGSENPVPLFWSFETEELTPSGLNLDMDSSWKICGERLLFSGVLVDTPLPETADAFLENADDSQSRVSGVFSLIDGTFTVVPLPLTGYGVQIMSANPREVFCLLDDEEGWRLCSFRISTGEETPCATFRSDATNVELLAVTRRGRVLYRTFDVPASGGNGRYFVGE